jgi:HSP20 family protein
MTINNLDLCQVKNFVKMLLYWHSGKLFVAPDKKHSNIINQKKGGNIMANIVKRNRATSPLIDFFNPDNFFDNNWLSRWEKEFPAVNIAENDKNYSLEVVAPGFRKEDFKLKVDDDVLTISAESKTEHKENENGKEKDYTRREYNYNSFTRSFQLPENVKDDSISAGYKDGILNIELPKSKVQVKASKEIAIK